MSIELTCLRWLRSERGCMIVLNERSPLYTSGRPDLLGVTKARECIEIEVKRTLSDFRANANKCHVRSRDVTLHNWPKQFYFAVPASLVEKVKPELPSWAGLISVDGFRLEVVSKAQVNREARKLSIKQCVHLAFLISNQMLAQASMIEGLKNGNLNYCHCYSDTIYSPWDKDYTNYQI